MKGLKDSFSEAEVPTEIGPIPSEEDMQHSLYAKHAEKASSDSLEASLLHI